tara:strand:+ start:1029 stop:1298 length:270 start_codon:yes stop_codon:yes gene_type:complete
MIDFKTYDKQNPQIWNEFKKYAFEAKQKGFLRYSAYSIFEIIRWHTKVNGKGKFKINNNFRPDYARKMMQEYPQFKGFFRTKELTSKRK